MSTTIDEKIVSMQFDNRNFEKNASTSMSTLDKLKEMLKFKNAGKGFEELQSSINKVDFKDMEYAAYRSGFHIQDIWLKVANVFEYQIAGRIISAGKNIAKSLTIDPIKTGLEEYETQIGAIQTILSNTKSQGTTLDDVNAALDELNLYADKTIYNFTQMTKNIGTFTAAGVDLKTSVSAIKGISNLAAISGSTSQQASNAMYQLSQALSSGTVKLMDWNSVVNANMGGKVFQDSLMETARVHGVAIDDMLKSEKTFRNTLQSGWLTSSILTETLAKFTGDLNEEQLKSIGYTDKQIQGILELGQDANDAATKVKTYTQLMDTLKESAQSGWSQTWRTIIGDFDEAKSMWTTVSDTLGGIIQASSEARNKIVSNVFDSGWSKFLSSGVKDGQMYLKYIKSIAQDLKVPLEGLLDKDGNLTLEGLQKGLKEGIISSDMMSKSLGKMSSFLKNCNDQQLKQYGFTKEQRDAVLKLNEEIQNGDKSIDEFANSIQKLSGRDLVLKSFANIFQTISNIISPIKNAFKEIFELDDAEKTADKIYNILEAFNNLTEKLRTATEKNADKIKRIFKGLFAVLDIALMPVKAFIKIIGDALGKVFGLNTGILDIAASFGDFLVEIRDSIEQFGLLGTIINKFGEPVQKAISKVKEFYSLLKEKIKIPGLEDVKELFKNIWETLKEIPKNIFNGFKKLDGGEIFNILGSILAGGGIGAAGFGLFKIFNKIKNSIDTFKSGLSVTEMIGNILDKINDMIKPWQDEAKSRAIRNLALSMVGLVAALVVLTSLDQEKLSSSIASIIILFGTLLGSLNIMGDFKMGEIKKLVKSHIINQLVTAIMLMALALKLLSTMDWSATARSLIAMGGTFTALLVTTKILSKIRFTKTNSRSVGYLMALTGALMIVALQLKLLATMDWSAIGRSLTAMGGAFLILTLTLAILSEIKFKKSTKTIDRNGMSRLLALTGILALIALSLKVLGTMSWENINVALIAMIGTFSILLLTLEILSKLNFKKSTKTIDRNGMSKLLALTGILALLAISLKVLGTMDWENIGVALTAMGGAFAILLGTLALLQLITKIPYNSNIKAMSKLLALTGILALLAISLKVLGTMNWESIKIALVGIAGALSILLTALTLVALISKISINVVTLLKMFASLSILSSSLLILAPALILFAIAFEQLGMAFDKYGASIAVAITAFTYLMAVVGVLAGLMSYYTIALAAVPILAVSILTLSLAFVVFAKSASILGDVLEKFAITIAKFDFWTIVGAILALTVIVGIFLTAGSIAGPLAGNFLLFAVSIIVFAKAANMLCGVLEQFLNLISKFSAKQILGAISTLATLIAVFVYAGAVASSVSLGLITLAASIALIGVSVALVGFGILAFVTALVALGKAGEVVMYAFINSIIIFLKALPTIVREFGNTIIAICDVIIAAAPKIGEALLVLLIEVCEVIVKAAPIIAEAVIKVIIGVLDVLNDNVPQLAEKFFTFLIKILTSLREYIPQLTELGVGIMTDFLNSMFESLKDVDISTIKNWSLALLKLSGVLLILNLIGPLIPGAIATVLLLGIFVAEMAALLWALGKLYSIEGFSDTMKDGGSLVKIIDDASKAMLTISALATVLITIGSFIPAAMIGLLSLSVFIIELSAVLSMIGMISKIPGLMELMSDGGNFLMSIGSIIGKFVGGIIGGIGEGMTSSLPAVASNLSSFMTNLQPFIAGIASLDENFGNNIKSLSLGLLALTGSNLINQIISWISGGATMDTFVKDLTILGNGVTAFANATIGITPGKLGPAAEAAKLLCEAFAEIPNTGGLIQKIFGENGVAGFDKDMSAFGRGILAFANATSGINEEQLKASADASSDLVDSFAQIPNSNGWFQRIFGGIDADAFKSQLTSFGKAIASFSKECSGISIENVDKGVDAGNTVLNGLKSISIIDLSNVSLLNIALVTYANGIKNFSKIMSTIDFEKTEAGIKAGGALLDAMNDVSIKMTNTLPKTFGNIGTTIMKAFISSIVGFYGPIVNTFSGMFSKISSAVSSSSSSLKSSFQSMGGNVVQGFINGIQNKIAGVVSAARSMASAASNAVKESLGIASPSKVFESFGEYSIEGFILGFKNRFGDILNIGSEVMNASVSALNTAISKISSMIDSSIDTQPTIKPILDLSNIKSGMNSVGGLFDVSTSGSIVARAQSLNLSMNNGQNGSNNDIISAIKDLKQTIGNNSGNNYSIGDITVSAGNEIDEAIQTLIRAINIERRV